MLKIGQNWGKIADFPPNAQQRSAPLNAILKYQNQARSDCQQMPETENFGVQLIIGGQYRGTKVPRYFLGSGTVSTCVVPVPRSFAIFWRYRYFSFVLFFSRDFKMLIKNLKRCKNACE